MPAAADIAAADIAAADIAAADIAAAEIAAADQPPDATELIRQTVARNEDLLEALRAFQYHRYREIRWLDGNGRVMNFDSTLHEVVIDHGAPYSKLVAEDGRMLDSGRLRRDDQKMIRELTRREQNRNEQRAYREEMRERTLVMRQMPEAFQWTLHGEAMHSNRPVWILRARPRAGWRPPTSEAKILTKVAGEVWVYRQELRMVKIEAHVEAHVEEVCSFAWFLLRIQPGFTFRFEQEFSEGGRWLPKRAFVKGAARIAGIKTVRLEIDTQYSGYRRHSNESRVVASAKGSAQ